MIDKCLDVFYGFKTYYPFNYINNNYSFSIYNYLIGFFFNSISSPQVLLLFIEEYNYKISTLGVSDNDTCYNEMRILFNFIKIYFSKVNLEQYKNDIKFEKLDINSDKIMKNY